MPKVLVVEDNAVTRKLITAWLDNCGCNVIEAADGSEALNLLNRHDISLILLDLQMQPMGGLSFLKYYQGLEYKAPVVMITGDESSDVLSRANQGGAAAILKKPITEDRIAQVVAKFIEKN